MASKGLGRGLDALLPTHILEETENDQEEKQTQTLMLDIEKLEPNPNQPRKSIGREALEELAASIRSEGIIQPLLVRTSKTPGKYEIIAGERRWRAARMAHLREVPAYIRELSDQEVMVAALVENLQRENLNAAEEAQALQELKDKLNLTQEELAQKLGKSRSMIANSLRLLQLPAKGLESLQNGQITAGHARCLLSVSEAEGAMDIFLTHILAEKMTVRECEDAVSFWKKNGMFPWGQGEMTEKAAEIRRKKSSEFKQLEKTLGSILQCKTTLSGTTDKGKLSLTYKSEDELIRILSLLGMQDLPGAHSDNQ